MERKINHGLNLLRIISMLGIIGLHVLNAGGGMDKLNLLSASNAVLRYIYIFCACSVDTFAMMTGYLYAGRTSVRYRNLLSLLVTVFFHCFVITCGFYFFNRNLFGDIEIATSLNPFRANRFWYITCYVLLFMLIPYINILLNNIHERQLDILVVLLFVVTSVLPASQRLDFFRMDWGYSSAWMVVCYILGAYIKRKQASLSLRSSLALTVAISLAIFGYTVLREKYGGDSMAFSWATEYVAPGIVLMSMLLVSVFSRLPLENGKFAKGIAAVGAAAFDVYIVHAHVMIYKRIITDGFWFLRNTDWFCVAPVFAGILAVIYGTGLLACKIRSGVFRLTKLDILLEKLGARIDTYMFTQEKEGNTA